MEDAVTSSSATLARTATLVVVGSSNRLAEAADIIRTGDDAGALRVVLISTGPDSPPAAESQPDVVSIAGLRPEYVNNAIAGVRLSSLPTVVWWREGPPDGLGGVATLADRVILDADDPWPLWPRVVSLFEHTGFTDMRWARLTRWRAAMAHFFDLPDVRDAAPSFSTLTVTGSDRPRCALFAGWLDASLGWKGRVAPAFASGAAGVPIESATLSGSSVELVLRLLPNRTCLNAEAQAGSRVIASRVVSVGDQRLPGLLSEELRVRSRDLAFERSLQSAVAYQS